MSFSISGALDVGLGALLPDNGPGESFQFNAGPYPPSRFVVTSFTGQETLSGAYSFDIELLTPFDDIVQLMPATVLRQPASLRMAVANCPPRVVHGVISKFAVVGADRAKKQVHLRARLVPKLWLLSHRTTSRIFQNLTVDEIVSTILDEWGLAYRWSLKQPLPLRTYATQYRESDLAFISRLLAEEGVFFYFEQPPAVLDDATGGAVGAIAGAASLAGSIAGGAVAEVASQVNKVTMETMVLASDELAYPPISAGAVEAAASIAVGVASSIGGIVGEAVATVASALSPALKADLNGSVPAEDHVFSFGEAEEARPESVLLADYDFRRPLLEMRAEAGFELVSAAKATATAAIGGTARLSLSPSGLSVGGAVTALKAAVSANLPSAPSDRYRVYLHDDDVEDETNWGHLEIDKGRAKIRLEQERSGVRVAQGQSWCRRLAPGHRFCIESHPLDWLNTQYVVTAIQHFGGPIPPNEEPQGSGSGTLAERAQYQNLFVCVPATAVYRPPIPARPVRQAMETAAVVGPAGEEIHVDEHGRIKVQFHWDLEGTRNERSSCWLRTTQGWSGGNWGTQFIPRIGMEVLVTFLGGNPDRPLVVGCLPNAVTPVPFALPSDATRSGLRTQSSPNGNGFNELSFEDLTANEQIYLHAQRDLDEEVVRNHTEKVGVDEIMTVGHNQSLTVGDNRSVTVGGVHTEDVTKNQIVNIHGDRHDTVDGNLHAHVIQDSSTVIEGRSRVDVLQQSDQVIADDLTIRVKGCYTTLVGKHDAKRSSVLHVEGTSQISSSETMEIVSDKRIVIRCGESQILIGPKSIELQAGAITVKAKDVTLAAAEGKLKIAAKSQTTVKSEKIGLASSGASVGLGQNAAIDGQKVKINCGPESNDDKEQTEEKKPTEINLKDGEGKPIPHQRFLIVGEDGSEYGGVVDKDGKAKLDLEKGGKLSFPELGDYAKK